MDRKSMKLNGPLIIILYILAAVLFIYGIYMVISSVQYVNSYKSASSVTLENAIQYIVTSSAAYLAFSFILLSAAVILQTLNKIRAELVTPVEIPVQKFSPLQSEEPETKVNPAPVQVPEPEKVSKPAADTELSPQSEPAADTEFDPQPEADAQPEPEPVADTEPNAQPEPRPDTEAEPDPKPVEKISSSMIKDIFEHR